VHTPPVPGPWQLTLHQASGGYRFSLEAFLLTDFVSVTSASAILDLGTGCGVVALFLARRFPHARVLGMELQASLASIAWQNIVHNGLGAQVSIVQADARDATRLFPAGAFGTVICNPPYRVVGSGRLNPNPEKAMARHELTLTLAQLVQACRHGLARNGLLAMVYHPSRLAELCARLDAAGLRPRRMRLVHATPQAAATMVLVEAVQGSREALTVLPPLFVYVARGCYSAEMQAIFAGRALHRQGAACGVQRGSTGQ
jgi:tRNA1Val (adenine37-N6)-methyltransferase